MMKKHKKIKYQDKPWLNHYEESVSSNIEYERKMPS